MWRWIEPILLAVALSAAALVMHPFGPLGRQLWPPAELCPIPTAREWPLCALLAFIEAVAFGVGVVFLIYGYSFVSQWFADRWRAICVHIGISWQLANWWIHDSAHMHVGLDIRGILIIDYIFHVTLIVSALAMVLAFVITIKEMTNAAQKGLQS